MYFGLGQVADVAACSSLNVPAGTFGPFNCVGDQADAYAAVGDSGVLTTEKSAFVCPLSTVLVDGVCLAGSSGAARSAAASTGVMAWLGTGNNALYAGGAVLGLVLLVTLAGGRR